MKITEGKSKKFIAILISLLVIGGMLAKTKNVAADQKTLRVTPFDIQISGRGAVEWTNASKNSGSYSVKLSAAPSSLASVGINAYADTIDNLTSLSFYYQHSPYADGVGPRMFLFLQKDNGYYVATTHCVVVLSDNDWKKAIAVPGVSSDFAVSEENGIWDYFPVDDTGFDQIGDRVENLTFTELQDALTGAKVLFAGVYVQAGAEEGPGGAYVDDIEINGITYYGMIQDAVDTAADDDTIYVSPGTYNEEVVVSKRLFFATDPGETVYVTSFGLRNAANISEGAFSADTVYVKTGGPDFPGGGIGDALNFVKDGGEIEVEGKEKEETCQHNHWTGGLTINKSLTLKSSSDTTGEEVCLTDENNPAITIIGGTVTIENFILFGSAVGVKAEGGQTTIRNSVIINNTHGITTSGSAKVDAAYNWWGEKSGPYNKTKNPQGKGNDISDNVVFCPFYKNKERTDLDRSLCPPSSSSSSSPANPSPKPPSCDDQPPFGTPDLFQIDTAANSATLYFAPASMPYNKYFIAYGYSEGDERFGVEFNQDFYPGVIAYTIYCLSPNTTYYFKVRPGNGCMPGDWGNTMEATTVLGNKVSKYYRYFPSPVLTAAKPAGQLKQPTKTSSSVAPTLTPTTKPTPVTTIIPTAKPFPRKPAQADNTAPQQEAKKRCFLFWCW